MGALSRVHLQAAWLPLHDSHYDEAPLKNSNGNVPNTRGKDFQLRMIFFFLLNYEFNFELSQVELLP